MNFDVIVLGAGAAGMRCAAVAGPGVRWAMPVTVNRVARLADDAPGFEVATTQGGYRTRALVVATGGLSIPKIGATPFGYRLAEQFGLNIVPPKPALVPLAAPPEWLGSIGGVV